MNALVQHTDAARPSLVAGNRPIAIVPTTMDEAYRLGKAICAAGMAPRGMETPEKCMIAIMRGLEVGLTPMQAVDKIAIVNGRPTIWGDGAMALVRASGLCEYVRETIEGEGDKRVALCSAKRKGEAEPISRRFGVEDAKKASLWGKGGPWQQYPERMLQMRARAFTLRDLFADVLGGLYLREEMEDDRAGRPREQVFEADGGPPPAPPIDLPDMRRATAVIEHKPAAPAPAPEQPAQVSRLQAQAVVADPAAAASNSDDVEPRPGAEILAEAKGHLDGARTLADLIDIRALYSDEEDHLTRSERETFEHLFEEAEKRVRKPAEPVEAPEATKEPAAAETAQAANVETWATYSTDLMARADACKTADDVAALRLEWAATKPKRVAFERAEQVTVSQLRTFARKLGDLFLNFEAPKADPAPAAAPAAPGLSAITAGAPEAVRTCGERIFGSLSTAPTKEKAFLIWSRSQRDRDECGASAEVLAAWTKEYQAIRKALPEEAA